MRSIITITLYDLLRSIKQRETFLFGLLMPGLMMVLLGVAMGGDADSPTIRIDVLDEDGSALSGQFVAVLQNELEDDPSFVICTYRTTASDDCSLDKNIKPADWRKTADQRMKDTDTFGAIIIEVGFGDKLRAGETVGVTFKSSGDLSAPTLAEQKIDAAVSRMSGSVAIANLTVAVAEESFGAFGSADDRAAAFDTVRGDVETAWADRPIRVVSEATQEEVPRLGFNQSGPGITIMFVLIFMLNASTVLVSEREMGTLQRLYTLPLRKAQIIAGKLLGQYVYGLLIFAVLVVMGVIMGVEWGGNVPGIVLVMLVFTLTSTALGLALATVVRTSEQANNISMLMVMTLAPLGGAWWPMEIVPDFMKTIGHLSPVAWGMDAFQEMMFYGGGVIDILPMLGVLLLMALIFFGFGVFNFKYE
jgi:ABC-2 type transport system permease protein